MKSKSIVEMTKIEIINMAYREYKLQFMKKALGENGMNNAIAEANGDINKAISRYKNHELMPRSLFEFDVLNSNKFGFMEEYLSPENYEFWEKKHG